MSKPSRVGPALSFTPSRPSSRFCWRPSSSSVSKAADTASQRGGDRRRIRMRQSTSSVRQQQQVEERTRLPQHPFAAALHERLGAGESVRSAPFSVGGYDWAVRFFPDGGEGGALALLLELLTQDAAARASCAFRFLNPATGAASARWALGFLNYRSGVVNKRAQVSTFRWNVRMYAHDDRLTVECAVTVVQEPKVSLTSWAMSRYEEPPSDLSGHLGRMLEEKEGSDVTFDVEGEAVAAHKIVLAMRSPVFKAQFYGPATEKKMGCVVTVEDVRPAVFRALLRFIYTDSLPDMEDLGDDDGKEMFRHLLVAADRYQVKRLKLMCEDSLCKSLSADSVATTLAFAEEQNLCSLKDACIEFIALSSKIDDVMASKGYAHLKRSCPSVLLDVLEKSSKLHKV
ncbi:BTB/POZ and MATH domain-containing protein 1-like [Panicum miliaceum]|uniref:BTB/POZ and MATH domain-containing protein 1-like n=1 Tax=Panicum miliaceum TaxID=4540 RepID=A0A3L6RLQ9_PANMI|nr:BTB/POZ and MATH domain-containing protein 1-like [Panicum miliaceum]